MDNILQYITLGSSILLTVLILLQARGASLGAGFGGSGELHTTRRGVDKTLHQATILVAVAFVGTIIFSLTFA